MIIQGRAIRTCSGAEATAHHIFSGEKNERIDPIQGNRFDMEAMIRDAGNARKSYGFVHFKINPKDRLSLDDIHQDFTALAAEYGFSLDEAVIVRHIKPRADGTSSDQHFHLIAPYVDAHGRAMNLRHSYARNEKLGRLSELRTGQPLTQGQHNRAVFHRLMAEGKTDEAEQVRALIDRDRACVSHTVNQQRRAERQGLDLPAEKQVIRQLWKRSDGICAFMTALADAGYDLRAGEKAGTYIIEKGGQCVGAANRLVGIKKQDFKEQYVKEIENVRDEKNNPSGEDIHACAEGERTGKRDIDVIDAGVGGRVLPCSEDTGTSGSGVGTTENAHQITQPAKRSVYDTLAKARLNSGLSAISNHGVGYIRNSRGEMVESNELIWLRAYNNIVSLQKDIDDMERLIKEYFKNLSTLSFGCISIQTIRRKMTMNEIGEEVEKLRTTLARRPIVMDIRDIQKNLEEKPMREYLHSEENLKKIQSEIENLEKRQYGPFGFLTKSYRSDREKLAALGERLPYLIKEAGDKNLQVSISRRLSYDRAKSERERQVRERQNFDMEHQTDALAERMRMLMDVQRDIQLDDGRITDAIHKNGMEVEINSRCEALKRRDEQRQREKNASREVKGKDKHTNAPYEFEEDVSLFGFRT